MKNNKGFTLMELLAVIVVLSIIMVIAVIGVTNLLSSTYDSGWVNVVESVEKSIELKSTSVPAVVNTYTISSICDNETDSNKDVTQTIRTISGMEDLNAYCKKDTNYIFTLNGKEKYKDKTATITCNSDGICNSNLNEGAIIVDKIDEVPCELAVDENDSNILYIDSIEDFYAFSSSTNKGNSYSDKKIKLRVDLNFSGYEKTAKTTVCNQNDNVNGFTPIGTFYGVFDGGAKTISNLDINLPSNNNVGLFSVNRGTIRGLNIINSKINGNDSVGAIVGLNYGGVKSISVDNVEVNGNSNVNFISRNSGTGASHANILIKSGKTNGNIGGNDYYGYVVGTVTAASGSYNSYYSNSTIIGDVQNTSGFNIEELSDINFYESYKLDTWIGGDNDSDGYYFDYESNNSNNIVLKSKDESPMNFNLSGSGTSADPYIINNENDWKIATLDMSNKYYFKLQNNLDFANKKFYLFGSKKNIFNGIFDGGAKTIKNVTINLPTTSSIGIFGYLEGWKSGGYVYGLNIENINITGKSVIGGLVGEASGPVKIYEISLKDVNVVSSINSSNAGLVSGYSGGSSGLSSDAGTSSIKNILIKSGSSTGKIICKTSYTSTGYILVESATVGTRDGVDYYSNQLIVNGTAETPNPSDFTSDKINNLSFYKGKIETLFDGDSNNTEYYFAYDNKKNGVYLVTVGGSVENTNKTNPIIVTANEAVKTVKISDTGKYKLEVWGAQGGSTKSGTKTLEGGYGSYSVGYINLTEGDVLYVTVGVNGQSSEAGTAKTLSGGYNGGGNAYMRGTSGTSTSGGGGATHIAKVRGPLSSLSSFTSSILIVAGGGGGSHIDTDGNGYDSRGGNAGGYIGNPATQVTGTCSSSCTTYNYPSGGTQLTGGIGVTSWSSGTTSTTQYVGTFGQGATGSSSYGGGGGGYYGGASGQYNGGGGGSGYISPLLTDAAMYCYNCTQNSEPATKTISNQLVNENPEPMNSKIGAGYARITYILQ